MLPYIPYMDPMCIDSPLIHQCFILAPRSLFRSPREPRNDRCSVPHIAMAKSVLDALKATGCADLSAAIEAVSANMFKIKEGVPIGIHGGVSENVV